ncbi:MAG TPA: YkgJ family cysteine cluster protein [Candidatus Sulfopaludibacter sp.]|nr:YkgJ family cysteine cluster protein [Candidatus Sulfopaludibacter sp.]
MADALRFACQPGCIKCCEQKGFVYLTEPDVLRIAEYLGMRQAAFEKKYLYRTAKKVRLRVPEEAQCPFLLSDGCSIHVVKPTQCRVFPFWPEMLESKEEWLKAGDFCPGIGEGPLVQIESARKQAEEMRAGYPGIY